jgi:hypothetical protein
VTAPAEAIDLYVPSEHGGGSRHTPSPPQCRELHESSYAFVRQVKYGDDSHDPQGLPLGLPAIDSVNIVKYIDPLLEVDASTLSR